MVLKITVNALLSSSSSSSSSSSRLYLSVQVFSLAFDKLIALGTLIKYKKK